jgi:hypothetical protein
MKTFLLRGKTATLDSLTARQALRYFARTGGHMNTFTRFALIFLVASAAGAAFVRADDSPGVVCSLQSNCISRLTTCLTSTPTLVDSNTYESSWSYVYDVESKYSCVTSSGNLVLNSGIQTFTPAAWGAEVGTAQGATAAALATCQADQAEQLLKYDGHCSQ